MNSRDHIKFNISFPTVILSESELGAYIEKLSEYSGKIRDINIAARIPPMTIDAHGVEMDEEKNRLFLTQMKKVQDRSGIPVSLTLNNIYVPNDQSSYDIFVKNYRHYYEDGFTHLTIPHIVWMDYGLRSEFPDADIKITTLRKIYTSQEFYNYAIYGFDLINIDRRLQRNLDELKKIKLAQKRVKADKNINSEISIICNESCVGTCRYFDEHYLYLMVKSPGEKEPRRMPTYSCAEYPDYSLRRFSVMGLKDNIDAMCQYIDVIKLAGRRAQESLMHPFRFIDRFLNSSIDYPAVLSPIFFRQKESEMALVDKWSEKIRNCKFECWNCSVCETLEDVLSRYYKMLPKGKISNEKLH